MSFEIVVENEEEARNILYRRINLGQKRSIVKPYSGDHVYDDRLKESDHPKFQKIPDSLYLYRFVYDSKRRLNIQRFIHSDGSEIPYKAVPKLVEQICQDARDGRVPEAEGLEFEDESWDSRCYLAIVYDDPNWEFLENDGTLGAVMFCKVGRYRKNKTFYDGQDLDVYLEDNDGNEEKRSAFFMINYSKDDKGDDLKKLPANKYYNYRFDIVMLQKLVPGKMKMVVFDPTGKNTGPP